MDFQAIVIIIAILLTVTIGVDASRGIRTFKDFALSRGFFGLFSLTCTLVATSIGGGLILGMAEKSFSKGIAPLFGPLGFFVQLIFIALIFAPRLNRFDKAITVGDIIEEKYGSWAKVCVGLVWLAYCIGLIVAQTNALSKVLAPYTHLTHFWNVIIGTGMVVLYCSFGGIRAVIKTDVIQFLILMVCLPLTLGISLYYLGGFSVLLERLPAEKFTLSNNYSSAELFSMFSTFMLSGLLIPPVAQRIMIAKTPEMASSTYLISAFITYPLVIIGCMFGLVAYAFNPEMDGSQAVPYLFDTVLPIWARPLAVSGLVAVVMSTADSYFNSGAVSIVHDVLKPIFGKHFAPNSELKLMKGVSWSMGFLAIIIGVYVKADTLDIAVHAFKFWGPMVVVPFVALLFDIAVSKQGFFACFFSGLATIFIWDVFDLTSTFYITSNIPGMLVNLTVFTTFYLFERQEETAQLSARPAPA